jgi:hypothetical protein
MSVLLSLFVTLRTRYVRAPRFSSKYWRYGTNAGAPARPAAASGPDAGEPRPRASGRPNASGSHDSTPIAVRANASGLVQTALSKMTRRSTSRARGARLPTWRSRPYNCARFWLSLLAFASAYTKSPRRSAKAGMGQIYRARDTKLDREVAISCSRTRVVGRLCFQRMARKWCMSLTSDSISGRCQRSKSGRSRGRTL